VRWVIGLIGRTLITLGLLMFAFVAYQLWGTGIQTAAKQSELRDEFEAMLAAAPPPITAPVTVPVTVPPNDTVPPSTAPGDTTPVQQPDDSTVQPSTTVPPNNTIDAGPPVTIAPPPLPKRREPLALLEIPSIKVDEVVVEGTRTGDLRDGPGHFPETPLPGQLGNSAIAGHRTTYGAPFFRVNELNAGDPVILTTLTGRYVYSVDEVFVIAADDYGSVIPTRDLTTASLTLISCHPRYTARERIVVRATLVLSESAPPAAPPIEVKPPDIVPGEDLPDDGLPETTVDAGVSATVPPTNASSGSLPVTTEPGETEPSATSIAPDSTATTAVDATPETAVAATPDDRPDASAAIVDGDAFSEGWFSDTAAIKHVVLWGLLLAGIAIAAWRLCRRTRRYWTGIAAGFVPFVVTLYFFFQNVNRLLPPGL
jgi:sortase A